MICLVVSQLHHFLMLDSGHQTDTFLDASRVSLLKQGLLFLILALLHYRVNNKQVIVLLLVRKYKQC